MSNPARPDPVIRSARDSDETAISRLLAESGLPTNELEEWLDFFLVAESGGKVIGSAGLELHGSSAILRSVAVSRPHRGVGLGTELVNRAVADARERGIRHLYLLTTTAASYFLNHGFRRIPREEAPSRIRESVEFREVCPDSAIAMRLDLRGQSAFDSHVKREQQDA